MLRNMPISTIVIPYLSESDSSYEWSDHQGHICIPVSNMCPQTTICAAFKDFIFSWSPF